MRRLLLILGMISILSAQTATIKNSITGYTSIGDSVTFEKPYLWSFIKSDDSNWMASIFVEAPWSDESVYVEELSYKPFGDIRFGKDGDKFTIGLGRQAIPFGSNVPYLDLTRGDKFTYQTPTVNDVGLLYFGDGISVYGGVGNWFFETYLGNDIENGYDEYTTFRVSYELGGDHFVGFSYDNQDRESLDISGYSKYVDYVTEFREDYQWGRAIVKTGKYGLSLLAGVESDTEKTQGLYGVVWQYGKPNRFLSTELSGDGDLRVKLYFGIEPVKIGGKSE